MKEREREGRYGGILGVWGPWASEPDYAPRDDLNLGRGQIASIIMAKPGLGLWGHGGCRPGPMSSEERGPSISSRSSQQE